MFFSDTSSELERERRELLERRARLRAQVIGDPDRELRDEIEQLEGRLRAIDDRSRATER